MSPRRQQPAVDLANGQPVRFYKIVALAFLLATILLLAVIVFISSKRAVITITAKSNPSEAVLILNPEDEEMGDLQVALATTTVALSKTFQPTGTRQEPAQAVGKVTLYNETAFSQPLVATTRLLTDKGVLFRLKERVLVPANDQAEAEVYADQPGEGGNIGPSRFTIPGLNEAKQEVIYAVSDQPMSGGIKIVGILKAEDIKTAEASLAELLKQEAEKILSQFYSDKKAAFLTLNASFKNSAGIGDEVSEFSLDGRATVLGVFYSPEAALGLAKRELLKKVVSEAELVNFSEEPPSVTINNYDLDNQAVKLKIAYSGLVALNPESRQLQKNIFFGKSKEEIRRYLLSLDHVAGVEVKFSPVWMLTAPSMIERINLVVKTVQ